MTWRLPRGDDVTNCGEDCGIELIDTIGALLEFYAYYCCREGTGVYTGISMLYCSRWLLFFEHQSGSAQQSRFDYSTKDYV